MKVVNLLQISEYDQLFAFQVVRLQMWIGYELFVVSLKEREKKRRE